ncbi:MAG: DUF429 domain-containing protein [Ferruginibacter sp.]
MKAVGIDGCKFGWVAVSLYDTEVRLFKNIAEIFKHYNKGYSFLIDIPIGLPGSNCNERTCESLARRMLTGHRKFSVFNVPCREAVYVESFEEANRINKKILSKGLSKQSWAITPKIREVDRWLNKNKELRSILKESHPEIVFHWLNGGRSMAFNKKSSNGLKERIGVLMKYDKRIEKIYKDAAKFKKKDVTPDDVADALCLAVAGNKINSTKKQTLPEFTHVDEKGIEMAMYYYRHGSQK